MFFSKLRTYQKIIIGLVFLFIFLNFLHAPKLIQTEGFSKAVYDSHGKLLRLTLSPDDHYRLWVPLTKIDNLVAVIFNPGNHPNSRRAI